VREVFKRRGITLNPHGTRPPTAAPRAPRRNDCERDLQIAALVADGLSRTEIAERMGMLYQSVCHAIRRIGLVVEDRRLQRKEGRRG
jgi:DNA-binding NarL/FixJ family response regulator